MMMNCSREPGAARCEMTTAVAPEVRRGDQAPPARDDQFGRRCARAGARRARCDCDGKEEAGGREVGDPRRRAAVLSLLLLAGDDVTVHFGLGLLGLV